ncbi:MAG: hypothetical protein ACXVB0_17555 [Mucilaginibacter sp.]
MNSVLFRLVAVGGVVTFVATKVTKPKRSELMSAIENKPSANKRLSAEMLLCRTGLCAANPAKPRAAKCCPTYVRTFPGLRQLLLYPFLRAWPALFCRILAEADLLMGYISICRL